MRNAIAFKTYGAPDAFNTSGALKLLIYAELQKIKFVWKAKASNLSWQSQGKGSQVAEIKQNQAKPGKA